MHVFVDESIRNELYLLCAVHVRPGDLMTTRAAMRALCHHGQRRVHMVKERDSSRREILSRVCQLQVSARLYLCAGHPVPARAVCLGGLLDDLCEDATRVTRLTLESMEGQDHRDREVIVRRRYLRPQLEDLTYEHMKGHEEPLLAIADVVAWAFGAGGDWRRRVGGVVAKAVNLEL